MSRYNLESIRCVLKTYCLTGVSTKIVERNLMPKNVPNHGQDIVIIKFKYGYVAAPHAE